MHIELWQYGLGALAAAIIGFAKTGVPGTGILMVPIMVQAFGPRLSIGATLPMLVAGDCMALAYYHAHGRWDHLKSLMIWVVGGLFAGTWLLYSFGVHHQAGGVLGPLIGAMVLFMLALSLLRGRLGDRLVPHSKEGRAITGLLAGFSTMVSNAAGPIMAIYMTSAELPKEELMGTSAWYFFIFNLSKVPLLAWLTWRLPGEPMYTDGTLLFDLKMVPVIAIGALCGRYLLRFIPQKPFSNTVLVLAGVAAVKLMF